MKQGKNEGVPVAKRVAIRRINRHLAKRGEVLKVARGAARDEVGAYFVIDANGNTVTAKDVNLQALARELGALKPYERLV